MTGSVDLGRETHLTLTGGLLLYTGESASSGIKTMATLHPVHRPAAGPASLGTHQLLSQAFLLDLSQTLGTRQLTRRYLPPNVLCLTDDTIVWWTAPCQRVLYFRGGSGAFEGLSGRMYPHPALVWKAVDGQLTLRALRDARAPTPETPLFLAPYPNDYADKTVCMGSMPRPSEHGIDAMADWESGYFRSDFNTLRFDPTAHPKGFRALWKPLAGRRRFPVQHLKRADQTLAAFIES
jgi:PRTRC genetic system protein B